MNLTHELDLLSKDWKPVLTIRVFTHRITNELSYDYDLGQNVSSSILSKHLTQTIVEMDQESRAIQKSAKMLMDIRDLVNRI